MSSRFAGAVAGLALALAAAPAWASTNVRSPGEPRVTEQLQQAAEHVDAGRCDEALPLLRRAMERPELKLADLKIQGLVYELAGLCDLTERRFDGAIDQLQRADKLSGLHDFGLRALFLSAYFTDQDDRAIGALERLEGPDTLKPVSTWVLVSFARELSQDQKQKEGRRRLLAALHRLDFKADEPFDGFDWNWAAYARMVHAEDPKAAAQVAARITAPAFLLELRLDARFAAVVEASPDRFDLRAATERKLAADRAAVQAQPERMGGPTAVAEDLRLLGRSEEALAVLDDALARVATYEDADDELHWLRNVRAYTLADLGRYAEAEAAMREAAGTPEHGTQNVSQTINLSAFLVSQGRADEALAVLKPFDAGLRASPYGDMWVKATQACAFAQQGRKSDLRKALAWMAAREDDNPAAHTRARLCADDLDGAAAAYVRRLADPEQRAAALTALSEFDPPANVTPHTAALRERLTKVRARADVQAAIARAGRVERVPLRATYWGDV